METKRVLLMYSGGYDSILSMFKLMNFGYNVLLVNYDNGCEISNGYEVKQAMKYQEKYYPKIEYIGKITTVTGFMYNNRLTDNIPMNEMVEKYGNTTISQIRCLNCRSAMYVESIKYCLDNNIHYIAEGARKSQLFSIEQPPVIESYKKLVNEYGLELLLPVWDLEDDFDKETLIMGYDDNRGGATLWGKSESKCVLGIPLEEAVPEEYTNTIKKLLEELIIPDCRRQIEYKYRPKQLLYKGNGNFPFL